MRQFDGKELIIASHNAGKVREIGRLLEPFGVEVKSAGDMGLVEPEETESTFAGNARIKAHAAAKATGLPALSDDSGLSVDALDGAPGVYTADWAETPDGRDFKMAMKKVWTRCEKIGAPEPRIARFHCLLCLAWPDGHDEVFDGIVEGHLVWPIRGENGFGFDPMFQPLDETETFGEMEPERKHGMSHRADAFAKLVAGCFGG
ncbi:RdgB/HAM1 family non-canonical purine NTP pyrophosphatase [Tropicimonas marinistellae]|uniref:RdgB/HAM1 family non-canonical purine NTP pyrophosphatase n=1 Tax=Tropicimonas marinistellae TaxID=1739787 RepID=UPI00082C11AC|nr:RdgB/HAM1 family non-canonical purine NTP pyrophosphatase [Tropicimonas marinistellae]